MKDILLMGSEMGLENYIMKMEDHMKVFGEMVRLKEWVNYFINQVN
jgi:hypothetical protein